MKRLVSAILFMILFPSLAFAQNITRNARFIATGSGERISLLYTGIFNHRISWTGSGTRTSCTIRLAQSIDDITKTNLIVPTDCTTDGTASITGWANFVYVEVSILTGANNTLYTRYEGSPFGGALGAVTATQAGVWTVGATQSGTWTSRLQDGSGNPISSTTGAVDVNIKYGVTVDVAHGAVDSGNPAKIGFRAASTEITPVTAAQRTDAIGSTVGGLLVHNGSLPNNQWENNSNGTAITGVTFVAVVSHIDGYYTDITSFDVSNAHATVGTVVKVIQGTGTLCGTNTVIRYELYAAPGGSGWTKGNGEGVIFSTTLVSQDICIAAVTTGASINWNMKGFFSALKRVQ